VTEKATAIAAGGGYSCALTTAGGVKCWGNNSHGQLGNGATTNRLVPVAVSGLASGVTAIAVGDHSYALTTAGAVKCWGANNHGQLGDGTTTESHTPVDVSGLAGGVTAIAAGGAHTCALMSTGAVKCWGRNGNGELGDGSTTDRNTPVAATGLASGVTAISVGDLHTCALMSTGGVKCWGRNNFGQLGNGSTIDSAVPVDVSGLAGAVAAVAARGLHTCALTSAGGVKCWGANHAGQLGDGTTTESHTPVDVSGLAGGVTAIAGGGSYTCATTSAAAAKCWGDNGFGVLGDGTTTERHTPVDVFGLASGVSAVAAGEFHTCALTSAGGVKCWGDNTYGELGDGTTTQRHKPVAVVGFGGSLKCLVPNVIEKPLGKAKIILGRAHCRAGRVTRVASRKKKGIVVGVSPRPGKSLKNGAKISLKVSRGR